ncbi:hypothetical protein MSG28_001064 [Choristoneura fumiferana]|uniref:Uncharacterized protein n=1 Tax=Choristoneura fumiferana TaxID=7141 RepID=A0ACC0K3Z4_CHOFU|nr:hypothetical protein MSG28_001064 [Choristoneura fumiferana]
MSIRTDLGYVTQFESFIWKNAFHYWLNIGTMIREMFVSSDEDDIESQCDVDPERAGLTRPNRDMHNRCCGGKAWCIKGAVPKGNATKKIIKQMSFREGQVIFKCTKCCSIKPERAHHCSVCQRCIRKMDHHCPWMIVYVFYLLAIVMPSLSRPYDPEDDGLKSVLPSSGEFEAFYPREAHGIPNGSSRPAHGHGSFYKHRNPALVDMRFVVSLALIASSDAFFLKWGSDTTRQPSSQKWVQQMSPNMSPAYRYQYYSPYEPRKVYQMAPQQYQPEIAMPQSMAPIPISVPAGASLTPVSLQHVQLVPCMCPVAPEEAEKLQEQVGPGPYLAQTYAPQSYPVPQQMTVSAADNTKTSTKQFTRQHYVLSGVALQEKINQLYLSYMPMDLNSAYHRQKKQSITKLNSVLTQTNRQNLQEANFDEVLLCGLTLIYYFGMRLKLSRLTSKYFHWSGKRQFLKAENVFQKAMDMLLPERSEATIKIMLLFFTNVALWPYESFVLQILEVVLYFTRSEMIVFNLMLTDIHYELFNDVKTARHRMRVLYELLQSDNLVLEKHKLLPFITRLLDFFANSIIKGENRLSAYKYLRKGFEVCLRRIFERAPNQHRLTIITTMLNWFSMVSMNDDDILEFSSLLDYAAELYKVGLYSESFREGLFDYVLSYLVGSTNALYSLVGCRLLQRFLDRQLNAPYLLSPTLYYEFSQVHLKIGDYDSSDKAFMRRHREKLHEYFIQAVMRHCENCVNLKALFAVVCCMILEVPCGLTAAAAACMMMTMQDFALNGENLSATCRYRMHAIVISVMSLICWVHKAPVLYQYVNQIIARRAKEAPQLNPPLVQNYNLGHHHVTWNKPTLFFEDWELRYGLWKHFQNTQVLLFCMAVFLAGLLSEVEGRKKKVVIHVPYKVKKIKHVHTVYKTIHHHHTHHEHEPIISPSEEHEHFHHNIMHIHDDPGAGQHSQPVPGIGIPEFLPDVPLDPLDVPGIPHDVPVIPNRHIIPLFRRNLIAPKNVKPKREGDSHTS